jgi:hypothetical protein
MDKLLAEFAAIGIAQALPGLRRMREAAIIGAFIRAAPVVLDQHAKDDCNAGLLLISRLQDELRESQSRETRLNRAGKLA